ncbi:EAL domain-containing protein [Sulfurimonas sp. SAG-AH-194-C21]|nr:EAL domain-containing protein [Sulfurimonas sp. SAG-AH-194-C21]MDF1882548.1 EAL domain-containing protein [Sulfurimonas sp. SAG-AH-194-C21]
MEVIYVSKQKIVDNTNHLFANELVFKDSAKKRLGFSNSLQSTAKLILDVISSAKLNNIIGIRSKAFINVDETTLTKGVLDILDKDRFILNILEDIVLTEEVIKKIIEYKKQGFSFSLEHFDSSARMLIKFKRLFNYIDIIKMDIILSEYENLKKVMGKFKQTRIKLLAQGVEYKEDFEDCKDMGFDYFEGSYVDKPELVELEVTKEPAQMVILHLIQIIKNNNTTEELEHYIKQQADLSFKLIQFFNNIVQLEIRIESLTQVITLMGRNKLLRWLVLYLYSEVSTKGASKTLLELAMRRAESMEADADAKDKDKAYLAGMFSLLGSIFDTDIKELMERVKMDTDITMLVIHKKGIFASSLMRAEIAEKEYLKKKMLENFEKLNTSDLVTTLEDGGVSLDKDDI